MSIIDNKPNLKRLRKLEKTATPGPWLMSGQWIQMGKLLCTRMIHDQNSALIVEMRNALPYLLRCAEAAEYMGKLLYEEPCKMHSGWLECCEEDMKETKGE